MPSVHDNHLYGYEFDARTGTLVLRTVYPHSHPREFTDFWFCGVWTHHLESVIGHDIILDVEESELKYEVAGFGDLFARLEQYAWPRTERRGDTLADCIQRHSLRVWHISSSYGVSGFVVAREARCVPSSPHLPISPPEP